MSNSVSPTRPRRRRLARELLALAVFTVVLLVGGIGLVVRSAMPMPRPAAIPAEAPPREDR